MTPSPASLASWTTYPPTVPAAPVTATVAPAGSASVSSASRAVSPFIGRVAAWTSESPAGIFAAERAGTTTSAR
ncbi:hypothetical protein ACFQQB_54330 [Nonomuraea rubra]|uniref:hypothetical protein n=1 Tax=Nonomuraea rubra TaxID=46180 RepID=UPI003622DD8A